MKIYVSHATSFDFEVDLYEQLRRSPLAAEHDLIFPHASGRKIIHSKPVIEGCDLVLAEVSFPSTGSGIELGWADVAAIPIICLQRQPGSSAVAWVARAVLYYTHPSELRGACFDPWDGICLTD
jgi:hypothetical protein